MLTEADVLVTPSGEDDGGVLVTVNDEDGGGVLGALNDDVVVVTWADVLAAG